MNKVFTVIVAVWLVALTAIVMRNDTRSLARDKEMVDALQVNQEAMGVTQKALINIQEIIVKMSKQK